MKNSLLIATLVLLFSCQKENTNIISSDVDNYWKAYDKITTTNDTILQQKYLQELFIDKASEGQKALFAVRRYTPKEYLQNIKKYPKFWNSIRENMMQIPNFSDKINSGVDGLQKIYPKLKPGKVYFGVGAFRTPGTTLDSLVLIGAELAMATKDIDVSEFPENHVMKRYPKTNKLEDLDFLNVHEFVHTQQHKTHNFELIKLCVFEGVPEFIAEKVMNKKSVQPAINYGQENAELVKKEVQKHLLCKTAYNDWVWNNDRNIFNTRDVGYSVGYEVAKSYYEKASDKKKAIQELIDVDFSDDKTFDNIVDTSKYFDKPMEELRKNFKASTPKIIGIKTFENGSQNVNPNTKIITVEFAQPMQKRTGFDLGPLGMGALMRVQRATELFTDKEKRFLSFEVNLKPNKRYQLVLGTNFRNLDGVRIQEPYLIDFKTGK